MKRLYSMIFSFLIILDLGAVSSKSIVFDDYSNINTDSGFAQIVEYNEDKTLIQTVYKADGITPHYALIRNQKLNDSIVIKFKDFPLILKYANTQETFKEAFKVYSDFICAPGKSRWFYIYGLNPGDRVVITNKKNTETGLYENDMSLVYNADGVYELDTSSGSITLTLSKEAKSDTIKFKTLGLETVKFTSFTIIPCTTGQKEPIHNLSSIADTYYIDLCGVKYREPVPDVCVQMNIYEDGFAEIRKIFNRKK